MNFKAVLITAWIWFLALATAYETASGAFLVCDSPECTQRAKLLNESLNTSIDPCTNFYSYVCDRWESNHPLTDGRKSYDVYDEIHKDIPKMLSDILGNITRVESNQTIINKVATMYNACLALPDTREALIRVLNASGYNAWPILTEGNIFNSSNCTDLLHHVKMSSILHLELSKKVLYARKPVYHYEVNIKHTPIQEKIERKVNNIAAVINYTISLLNPAIDSSVLDNLTNQLAEFSSSLSDIIGGTSDLYTISQLEEKFGNNIPISTLLKKEFEKVNISLDGTEKFNVHHIYYEKLSRFLKTADPNTLYNYAGFLALFSYLDYVQTSNDRKLTMSTKKGGSWSECITLLDESAREILDYLYVTNEPNHSTIKAEVEVIAHRLIQAFNETLQNNNWIDNKTREAFEKELKEAPLGIGYPDPLSNMSVLEGFYKYVPYFPSNITFTEALYYFRENFYLMELRKFRHPEESNWRWTSSARGGRRKFHLGFGNEIEIPYPIFVSPLFQRGLPRSLNYGGIGGAIARELGLTFSVNGMQTIKRFHKNLVTEEFEELFKTKTSCFEAQYKAANKEMIRERHLKVQVPDIWSGTDQAFADNTGLQMAFKAYTKVLEDECASVDTRLKGFENITGMQLFFISEARTQCKIADEDTLSNEIKQSNTPAQNRVNEAMKNLEAFAKAFNCPHDSPMRPNKTCPFW